MGKPFFSIVMPVWNGAAQLPEALKCMQAQTNSDWELVAVNDGSSDETERLLREAARKDSRIRVFTLPENRGAAEARNAGIFEAAGEYILFMDVDDRVDPALLQKIRRCIESCAAEWQGRRPELVVYGLTERYYDVESGALLREKTVLPEGESSEEPAKVHETLIRLEAQTLYGYLWNKAYQASLLQNSGIRIPRMRILEDIYYNIEICQALRSIALIPEALYSYEKREGSATSKPIPDYYEIHRERQRKLYRQYQSWGCLTQELRCFLQLRYSRYLFSAVLRRKKGRGQFIRSVYRDDFYQELFAQRFGTALQGSRAERIMHFLWKRRMTAAILCVTQLIQWSQTYGRRLFLRISKG